MVTRVQNNFSQPFGLHDMRVSRLEFRDTDVGLVFPDGIVRCGEPYRLVTGSVWFEGVDLDYAAVIIQSVNGRFGGFRGEKLELAAYAEKYPDAEFEIVEEYYGFRKAQYSGFLWMPGKEAPREMTLSIGYYTGDMIYITDE